MSFQTNYFVAQADAPAQTAAPAAPAETTTTIQVSDPGAPAPKPSMGETIGSFLPMILIIAVMFFLMWRGQKKEQQKRKALIESVAKGSKIVTIGGIHGKVSEVKDDRFIIEIAEGVKITVAKSAVATVVDENGAAAAK